MFDIYIIQQIEIWIKVIGSFLGLLTAAGFLFQYRRANKEKSVDLSRKLLDGLFGDAFSRSALRMLDWDERLYEIPHVGRVLINKSMVKQGLRVGRNLQFGESEQYVRDCFEKLYDQIDFMEHFVQRKLLDFADLQSPLSSYVGIIHRDIKDHKPFLETYDYGLALAFFERFPRE